MPCFLFRPLFRQNWEVPVSFVPCSVPYFAKTRGVLLPCFRDFRPLIRRIRGFRALFEGLPSVASAKLGAFRAVFEGLYTGGPLVSCSDKVARQFRQESRRSVATIWCYCKAITCNLFVSRPMLFSSRTHFVDLLILVKKYRWLRASDF